MSRNAVAAVLVPLAALVGLLVASPAQAETGVSTITAFPSDDTLSIDFGDSWVVPIAVTNRATYADGTGGAQGTDQPVESNAGTVDVFLDGTPGAWATQLPLQPGGIAYFSQPAARAPLGTGTHTFTAVFEPAAGSGYTTSKTVRALTIEVAGFDLAVRAKVVDDPSSVTQPTLDLSLAGSWLDQHEGKAPAGTWSVVVTDVDGGDAVLRRGLIQKAEVAAPISIPFGYRTDPGHRYRISITFAPAIWLAPGIAVTQASEIGYRTTPPSPLAFLVNPVGMPWGIAAVIGGAVLLLLAAATLQVVFAERTARRIEELEDAAAAAAAPPVVDPITVQERTAYDPPEPRNDDRIGY